MNRNWKTHTNSRLFTKLSVLFFFSLSHSSDRKINKIAAYTLSMRYHNETNIINAYPANSKLFNPLLTLIAVNKMSKTVQKKQEHNADGISANH